MQIDEFLTRFQGVKQTGRDSWMAKCSSHPDKSPSLAIRDCGDGRILVKCFAECGTDEVLSAVGLEMKDLMPENLGFHRRKPTRIPFNALDVLCGLRTDLTVALVLCKDMQAGKVLDATESLLLAKLIGRVAMGIQLAGSNE